MKQITQKQFQYIKNIFSKAERLNIPLWLESGWAIDFLSGKITREHEDIDIVFSQSKKAKFEKM